MRLVIAGDGADIAVGHQTQLDEGLEAVADAQHQSVPVFQQLHGGVGHLGVAEEGGDELGGAVGLVAAGEAAGDEDDLTLAGGLGEALGGKDLLVVEISCIEKLIMVK